MQQEYIVLRDTRVIILYKLIFFREGKKHLHYEDNSQGLLNL